MVDEEGEELKSEEERVGCADCAKVDVEVERRDGEGSDLEGEGSGLGGEGSGLDSWGSGLDCEDTVGRTGDSDVSNFLFLLGIPSISLCSSSTASLIIFRISFKFFFHSSSLNAL